MREERNAWQNVQTRLHSANESSAIVNKTQK